MSGYRRNGVFQDACPYVQEPCSPRCEGLLHLSTMLTEPTQCDEPFPRTLLHISSALQQQQGQFDPPCKEGQYLRIVTEAQATVYGSRHGRAKYFFQGYIELPGRKLKERGILALRKRR